MKNRFVLVIAFAFLISLGQARAQSPASLEYDGSILQGGVFDVIVANHLDHGAVAFSATHNGLEIIDVNEPSNPTLISRLDLFPHGQFRDMKLLGDFIYMSSWRDFILYVIDVSDLSLPTFAGSYELSTYTGSVDVAEDYAYLTAWDSMIILRIDQPENITFVSELPLGTNLNSVMIQGDVAFVAGDISLLAIDISDRSAPELIDQFYTSVSLSVAPFEIDRIIDDTLMLLAELTTMWPAGGSAVTVINIKDPSNMSVVGRVYFRGEVGDVGLFDNFAFAPNDRNGLQIIDISDLTNLDSVGSFEMPGLAFSIEVFDSSAVVLTYGSDGGLFPGEYLNAFRTVDISDPLSPHLAGEYAMPDQVTGVTRYGDHVLLFNNSNDGVGVRVVDIASKQLVSSYSTVSGTTVNDGVVRDSLLYVIGSNAIEVINLSDPTELKFAGSAPSLAASDLTVRGGYAYVATGSSISIFKVADPTDIKLISTVDLPGMAAGVVTYNEYVYSAIVSIPNDSKIAIVNISDPENQGELILAHGPNAINNGIAESDGILYLKRLDGFDIYDARTNPEVPAFLGTFSEGYPPVGAVTDIFGLRNHVVISDGYDGLRVINVSDPANPFMEFVTNSSGYANRVYLDEEVLVVADVWSLMFFDHAIPTDVSEPETLPKTFVLHQNYPNPFNPITQIRFQLPHGTKVSLVIYNVLGQEVETLIDRFLSAGEHTIPWHVSENSSGVYFYRLQTEEYSDTRKMVLLK